MIEGYRHTTHPIIIIKELVPIGVVWAYATVTILLTECSNVPFGKVMHNAHT